jgi:hypothetical protein
LCCRHILHGFNTQFLTRFRTYIIASPPQTKTPVKSTFMVGVFIVPSSMSYSLCFFCRKVGRKVTYLLGSLLALATVLWVYFGAGESADPWFASYGIFCVAAMFGAAGSTVLVSSLALTAELIGKSLVNPDPDSLVKSTEMKKSFNDLFTYFQTLIYFKSSPKSHIRKAWARNHSEH